MPSNYTSQSSHPLRATRTIGPLFIPERFKDAKDPCICFDGTTWHIYGSGGDTFREEWEILHATAPHIEGPWSEQEPARLRGVDGPHVAAPTVMYDPEDKLFHMAVQKDFVDAGGIAYLVSADGHIFTKMRSLMEPKKGGGEHGLYDPHFSVVRGTKYLVYAGIPRSLEGESPQRIQPDIYLARSVTDRWAGTWKRMKAILRHEDIAWHHNQREHPDYEWGIEGPQLVELPATIGTDGTSVPGKILLNATCFIEEGRRGTRQRVFFALADTVDGPFTSLGPVLPTTDSSLPEWENGENGHASAIVHGDELFLFYQGRSKTIEDPVPANPWRYGIAVFKIADILRAGVEEKTL